MKGFYKILLDQNKKNRLPKLVILLFLLFTFYFSSAQQTQTKYLSGLGKDDMVNWDFYCTAGMNSGKWTTIGVPSCWELQGFGKYDYGFAKDSIRGKEKGMYKYQFDVPSSWKQKQVNIVFEGSMTDTEVKINGQSAGATHQGAFYSFKYDISRLLKYEGPNLLEVTVSKQSANASVNAAERKADFWIFGGIFRPVFLEAIPTTHINQIAIDAKADGTFNASVTSNNIVGKATIQLYDAAGKLVVSIDMIKDKDQFVVSKKIAAIKQWNTEFPNLYKAIFSIYQNGKIIHSVSQKFGFRTVEVKQRDGIYVNGVKMKFKGVNRHSFWPTSGRTTSKALSIEDVQLIKDMNMNAVRMSHYPPDAHFLDVCDSLGLFVMDELAGWHGHYDTPTGTKLVKEMIDHDRNHPCIILWSNGNEGGHNLELDRLFTEQDIQHRTVVHPWQLFNGVETQHYREYNYGIGNYEHGHDIIMPTEFLHGLYDGGHGAGLQDYWDAMLKNPLAAGGFLWDFADEGVVRKDKNDSVDTDGNHGADGIMGPYHEKEGSYFAIKEIWSPVYIEPNEITSQFDGTFNLENRFSFTNLNQCSFHFEFKSFRVPETQFSISLKDDVLGPDIKAFSKGQLKVALPKDWKTYDALYITAKDINKKEIFTWSFPITLPKKIADSIVSKGGDGKVKMLIVDDSIYNVSANGVSFAFNKNTGLLNSVSNSKGAISLSNGPVLQEADNNFSEFNYRFSEGQFIVESNFDKKKNYNKLQWTVYPSGWVKMHLWYFPSAYFTSMLGVNFSFPEKEMKAVEYLGNGPYRVWKNRMKGTQFGVWNKNYNSTETGEAWLYPEFKGYYSNMYWCRFITNDQPFTVVTENEDVFLRLFTPAYKTDQWHNYEPTFPTGDISFMQAIPSIGTKTQRAETTGPMGMKNIFYDYEKDQSRAKELVLYFNFSDKQDLNK